MVGKVSFWYGPTATLLQQFKTHDAGKKKLTCLDVLCLSASKDGSRVFSGSVDRKIVTYRKVEDKWVPYLLI